MSQAPTHPSKREAPGSLANAPRPHSLLESTRLIDQVLPQTQCQRCGFAACLPYAEAMAAGEAPINRCPPGGSAGIAQLADLTGQPVLPLDPDCGEEGPVQLAFIREQDCIGCVLCLEACPVDAIAGAFKRMHTVIAEDCTGCALCVPVCPVDCIELRSPATPVTWNRQAADLARLRFQRRQMRRTKPRHLESASKKQAILAAALARAEKRRKDT